MRRIRRERHGCAAGVYAKDVILEIIRRLGVKGGVGYAYEYAGDTIERMSMDERMTICNMSIEGGARVGYVNPDRDRPSTTCAAGRSRRRATTFESACRWWASMASDADAPYDDEVEIDAASIRPTVTWGINPGPIRLRGRAVAEPVDRRQSDRAAIDEALDFMGFDGRVADSRNADRRRVRRLVHERAAVGSSRGRAE